MARQKLCTNQTSLEDNLSNLIKDLYSLGDKLPS